MGFARRYWLRSGNAPFARDLALNVLLFSQLEARRPGRALLVARGLLQLTWEPRTALCQLLRFHLSTIAGSCVFDCVGWLSFLFLFSAALFSCVRVFLSVQAARMVDHAGSDQLLLISCQDCAWLLQTVLANVA
jgi:hypothetical protein